MTHDQNKKTLRHFQCRDYLWDIFEQMSAELECSTDYLINEAMRQYARSRNYGIRTPSSPGMPRSEPASAQGSGIPSIGRGGRPPIPSAPPPPPPRQSAPYPGGAGYGQGYGAGQPGYPPQQGYGQPAAPAFPPSRPAAPPPRSSYPPPPTHRPPAPSYGGGAVSPSSAPPPLPRQGRMPAPQSRGRPHLFVIFNGQKIPVTKDEFVIGRGSKTADLPIKDGNISRRHACVVFHDGTWYMRDLGSTNGIEYGGRRIDSKPIEEGDLFQICDYELRFTYR